MVKHLAGILVVAPDWNTLNWDYLDEMGIEIEEEAVEDATSGKKGEAVEDADTDEEVSINRNFSKANHTRFFSDEDNTSSVEEGDSNAKKKERRE